LTIERICTSNTYQIDRPLNTKWHTLSCWFFCCFQCVIR